MTDTISRLFRSLLASPTGLAGAIIVLIFVLFAVCADMLVPINPAKTDMMAYLLPPMWLESGSPLHPLGTDGLGRDVLSRIVHGARISMLIGVSAVLVSGMIGLVLGLVSGYFGGWIDALIMRAVDAFHAVPNLLLLMVIMMIAGPGMLTVILVLGVTNWTSYARVVRGEVLSVRELDYVSAARSIGAGNAHIIATHVLPNIMSSFIVISTTSVAGAIISESSLSFLGMGVQPPDITWGMILSDGREYIATNWWIATFPGLAITTCVLGIILLGDWVRDILDPRLQGRGGN